MRTSKWLLALLLLPVASYAACPTKTPSDRACIKWTPPTLNTDGSSLTNLAGFRIYYGQSPTALTLTMQINSPTQNTQVIVPPSRGTWYFAIAAFATTGAESARSNVASKIIRFPGPTDGAIEAPTDGSIEPR